MQQQSVLELYTRLTYCCCLYCAELYRFVHHSLDCNPQLIYGDNVIISAEDSQQGDHLSGLKFCESVQPILLEREAQTTMEFVDDIDLEGDLSSVARDV